jgi:hypothetical protein
MDTMQPNKAALPWRRRTALILRLELRQQRLRQRVAALQRLVVQHLGEQAGALRKEAREVHAFAAGMERAREGVLQRLAAVSSGAEVRRPTPATWQVRCPSCRPPRPRCARRDAPRTLWQESLQLVAALDRVAELVASMRAAQPPLDDPACIRRK